MDDIDFKAATNIRKDAETQGKARYAEQSKIRLTKVMTTKIKTTMIGALASIENHFGFLWEPRDGQNSVEQIQMREIFEKLREEILNNGNNQIRNATSELQQYNVEWLRYSISLPIKQPGQSEEDYDG
jgi:hypothetical protein